MLLPNETDTKQPKLQISQIDRPWQDRLRADIETFHKKTDIKYTSIGHRAIKDSRMWERLVNGGTITIESADAIYKWMADQGYHFNS